MHLTKIKLAGFKSFVDPTLFHVPDRIVTVVGPNGCGKSNIIDAVRWVMGESAARYLRGDSMEDVIFNGSSARKPVGQASVELFFDNSEGRLSGSWSQYSEIAVRRQVDRGGQSTYFLNGTRCRRRDITDIFLGTGLGPRSYAIIEQGTISRVIESKPEELRVFLEEAAGISKYKERRRETENRIRHTLENLSRVNDICEELDRQLQHLHKQARNAERYKQLRAEERELKAQLLALRWQRLDQEVSQQQAQIAAQENRLHEAQAEQAAQTTDWTRRREQQQTLNDQLHQAEAEHYQLATTIAQLQQQIEHQAELKQAHVAELARTEQALHSAEQQQAQDLARLENAEQEALSTQAGLEHLQEAEQSSIEQLAAREQAWQAWQKEWEQYNRQAATAQQHAAVERTRIEQLERSLLQAQRRLEKIEAERDDDELAELDQSLEQAQIDEQTCAERVTSRQLLLDEYSEQFQTLRLQQQTLQQQLQEQQSLAQAEQGRLASLQTLQDEILQRGEHLSWLREHHLGEQTEALLTAIQVEPGWEPAVEMVLADWLDAFCLPPGQDAADTLLAELSALPQAELKLILQPAATSTTAASVEHTATDSLAQRVRAPAALQRLLERVLVSADSVSALARRSALQAGQSVVTPDGVWLGPDWLRIQRGQAASGGLLQREQDIRETQQQLAARRENIELLAATQEQQQQQLETLQEQIDSARTELNAETREHTRLLNQVDLLEQRAASVQQRQQALVLETVELATELEQTRGELATARQRLAQTLQEMSTFEQQQVDFTTRRQQLQEALEDCRAQRENARQALTEQKLRAQSWQAECSQLRQSIERVQSQLEQIRQRLQELHSRAPGDDVTALRSQLDQCLQQQLTSEQRLTDARQALAEQEQAIRALERSRGELDKRVSSLREAIQAQQLICHEAQVRRQTLVDQINELELDLSVVLQALPDTAAEADWVKRIEAVATRIQRLGAINLAAIEEHAQLAERKTFLDEQDADLREALALLEDAMAKIDRETRNRFKTTFEQVNTHLQQLYPSLFGGGEAYLELTGTDTLNAGVAIIARPPGKRPGTIQLLSGGEKALTAIALIFSIFQLNPAPFCMLDEVDAPLDDANVGRFGKLVEKMSEQVQFIIVTHNKTTMEIAQHLAGVTMHEPGVSRLVAVDVDEAVRMATA